MCGSVLKSFMYIDYSVRLWRSVGNFLNKCFNRSVCVGCPHSLSCSFPYLSLVSDSPDIEWIWFWVGISIWVLQAITLFRSTTLLCGTENIMWNISHMQTEHEEYFIEYFQSYGTMLWIWVMLWGRLLSMEGLFTLWAMKVSQGSVEYVIGCWTCPRTTSVYTKGKKSEWPWSLRSIGIHYPLPWSNGFCCGWDKIGALVGKGKGPW